jgi:hypothetical protein
MYGYTRNRNHASRLKLWGHRLAQAKNIRLGVEESLVTKATYENSFGVRADGGMALPVEYFERLLLQNEVFGDDSNLMVYGKFAHISTG